MTGHRSTTAKEILNSIVCPAATADEIAKGSMRISLGALLDVLHHLGDGEGPFAALRMPPELLMIDVPVLAELRRAFQPLGAPR
jgi:hypothetical protein